MALSAPYDLIALAVRSELDDNDSTNGFEVDDEKLQKEIDLAIKLRVGPDIVDNFYDENGILKVDIVDNGLALRLTSIEAARRIVSGFLQSSTRQNIAIRKGGTNINTNSLVVGLQEAVKLLKEKYNSEVLSNCEGEGFSY
jgi:hypothetical protein